jgi:hypothetical protein
MLNAGFAATEKPTFLKFKAQKQSPHNIYIVVAKTVISLTVFVLFKTSPNYRSKPRLVKPMPEVGPGRRSTKTVAATHISSRQN